MTDYKTQQLGHYQLVRHIGRGAFSDVYLGMHVHLKTPAAIKLLHTELTSDDIVRFRDEARTVARLEHPHIVRVLDFGIEDHTPFIVMVYAPNGTLRQRHPKGSILSLATVVTYVSQIASALQFAHDQKFIHRDIKPENMLLGRNNDVLLSDFGGYVQIAQSTNSLSIKEMAGTIPYMAPEQFQGKPRYASDQYSLAIVVYEWLTGERPFQGSALEIATQQMMNQPDSIRVKNPAVPPEVEHVILTALAKEPQHRFASVQAFANAFQQASNLVNPIVSASTISMKEVSELPSIRTQPISIGTTPQALIQNDPPSIQSDKFVDTNTDLHSSHHPELTKAAVVPTAHSQHRLSRRAVIFGLAGAAAGSIITDGIWMAKSAGLLGNISNTAPRPQVTALYTYTGHTGAVITAAWSPDGFRIASGSFDTTVRVWGAFAGSPAFTYSLHKDYVWSVSWSPDGTKIASAGGNYDKTVQIWDSTNHNPIVTFSDYTDGVNSVVWSPDGKLIATGGYDKVVLVRDPILQLTTLTLSGHTDAIKSVAWSRDGRYIASASFDHTVKIWDASNGNLIYSFPHNNYVKSVAWSFDSKYIASATGDIGSGGSGEHLVYVWDTTTKKLVLTYNGHRDGVATVAWYPQGKYIIASAGGNIKTGDGDTTVQVWDALSGKKILTYPGHHNMVNSVAWAPTGLYIASASWDRTVQVWKAV